MFPNNLTEVIKSETRTFDVKGFNEVDQCESGSNEFNCVDQTIDQLMLLMNILVNEEINCNSKDINEDKCFLNLEEDMLSFTDFGNLGKNSVLFNACSLEDIHCKDDTLHVDTETAGNTLEVFVEPIDTNEVYVILPHCSNGDSINHGKPELNILKIGEKNMYQECLKKNLHDVGQMGKLKRTSNLLGFSNPDLSTRTCSNTFHSKFHRKTKNHFKKTCRHNKVHCKHNQNNTEDCDIRPWVNEIVLSKDKKKFYITENLNDSLPEYQFPNHDIQSMESERQKTSPSYLSLLNSNFQKNNNNHCKSISRIISQDDRYGSDQLMLSNHSPNRGICPPKYSSAYELFNQNDNCNSKGRLSCSRSKKTNGNYIQTNQCCKQVEYHEQAKPCGSRNCGYDQYSNPCPQPCSPCKICNKNDYNGGHRENSCPDNDECRCGCSPPNDCCREYKPDSRCCPCTCSSSCSCSQDNDCSSSTVCCETSISTNCDENCGCPCPCRCPQFTQPPPYCLNSTYRMHYYEKGVPKFRRYKECDNLRLPLC